MENTKKKKLKMFVPAEVTELGKDHTVPPASRSDVTVSPSPLGDLFISGFKCSHGVYIPATSIHPDRAAFCSLCYPYILGVLGEANDTQKIPDTTVVPSEAAN